MNDFHSKTVEEICSKLNVDTSVGLKASEVEQRIKQYGENKLRGKKPKSIFVMFFEQLKDFLVIILIVAAILSIALGEPVDGGIILFIVVLNGVLGVMQENKANNALNALKDLSGPSAKVLRNGEVVKVASGEVTLGDIIVLDAGDYVPADIRLIESVNLKIDESALTGESVAVEKALKDSLKADVPLADRVNCAYMGTVVTYGRGRGVVTAIGMDTQMGKIAAMLDDAGEEPTHLQKKLNTLGKQLGLICIAVSVLIFGIGLLRGMEIFEVFMTSVSLAVAAIPEGLTVVVTVILALGMQEMVKTNAIVKKLSAVETLGSTTIICSDKTGTLTQNKMTVVKLYDTEDFYNVSGTGYSLTGDIKNEKDKPLSENVTKMLTGAVLCNDSSFNEKSGQAIGDSTEVALVVVGAKVGLKKEELDKKYSRVGEKPFDSDRKLMSTVNSVDGKKIMFTKGAPDEVLRRSTYIFKNGSVREINDSDRDAIMNANNLFAEQALRVLGVSYIDVKEGTAEPDEQNLTFLGLIAMIDPPREEAKDAIAVCKRAGIGVKMITGDHKTTAAAIGKELGIVTQTGAIDGLTIDTLSDEELCKTIKTTNIFARVSPEHKVRLIKAVKANGEVAAMTGDGVNDAPSLKIADIGVAMGITGTDVSKEAADMILTDDNFASIVKAVEQGRTIYGNIRKVVGYLLSCNIGEILVIFVSMLVGLPIPLMPIHLLSINLITDAFPAFALGMEEKDEGIMDVPPRDPKESIINRGMTVAVAFQSVFLAVGTLSAFVYGYYFFDSLEVARTLCFVTLVLGELLRAYSARSERKALTSMKIFGNSFLNKSVLASLVFVVAVVYVPFLSNIFYTTPLNVSQVVSALGFAILPLIGGEVAKVVRVRK